MFGAEQVITSNAAGRGPHQPGRDNSGNNKFITAQPYICFPDQEYLGQKSRETQQEDQVNDGGCRFFCGKVFFVSVRFL